jgi:FkbM family methyltransferase
MKKITKLVKNYGIVGIWIYVKLKLSASRSVSVPTIAHIITLRGATSDVRTFHQIFTDEEYNLKLDFYPQNIIDAGANIGLAAVYFANKYPQSKIVSIEPEAANYNLLATNVKHYAGVYPLNKALSNIQETLQVVDIGLGNWGFTTTKTQSNESSVSNSIETITIPQLMKQYNFAYLDIVKIDIEGYEKELFESNFEEWLPKTRCLIIELHDWTKKGCSTSFFKCISKYDFSCAMQGENLVFVNENFVVPLTTT